MTIHIVDIEAVDTRYTKQWKEYLPKQLQRATNENVKVISGGETPQATTPGAFLNFGGTNVYKSKQLETIGEMFCNGRVKDNDYFLYTDAWNPTVIQLKYMAELLGVDIKIGGLWHAGSYDPQDFLGRLIGDKPWVRHAEMSMFECYDDNFFASDFHIDMFTDVMMEDYSIDIMIDTGPNARTVQIALNPFTLIGATTRSGLLTSPLRARFGINSRLEYYNSETLTAIVERSSDLLKIPIENEAAYKIASRSRGTPRIANALLRRVRDFAQIKGKGIIDPEITEFALKALNVDENGLDEMDIRILKVLIEKFNGGPVGISTIATAIGENAGTLEEVYEPFLIQEGFLMRTNRGRRATEKAFRHLGKDQGWIQGGLF